MCVKCLVNGFSLLCLFLFYFFLISSLAFKYSNSFNISYGF